jgi:plastocyanin
MLRQPPIRRSVWLPLGLAGAMLGAIAAAAANHQVTVGNNVFSPASLTVEEGDTVTWVKAAGGLHNVAADGGAFRSGNPTSNAFSFGHTFTAQGAFPYHCEAHGGPGGAGMSGTVTVVSSDAAGSLALALATVSVGEGAGELSLTLTRTGGDDGAVSVEVHTTDGSAAAGSDYASTGALVSWADNDDDPKVVAIPILDDGDDEPNETFTVTLDAPTGGATLGAVASTTVTIVDNDEPIGSCVANASTLCLNQGRFQVRATWANAQGASGIGAAVDIGLDDTGLFTFFNPNNVELLVKVLNACAVAPFNNYWVFVSAATNQEWHLTVVDTQAGISKQYDSALGTFPPLLADTEDGFDTCP